VVPPGGIHSGSRILAPLWADDDDDDDDDELWRPSGNRKVYNKREAGNRDLTVANVVMSSLVCGLSDNELLS
jgi:hypothetical protein